MKWLTYFSDCINNNITPYVTTLVMLIATWIHIRYKEIWHKRQRFGREYTIFKNIISPAIEKLKHGNNLGIIVFIDFPIHEKAMQSFIHKIKCSASLIIFFILTLFKRFLNPGGKTK